MAKNIRTTVAELTASGMDPEEVARETQRRFPLKCASRSYVMRLIREARR